jgi:hypothetical protein
MRCVGAVLEAKYSVFAVAVFAGESREGEIPAAEGTAVVARDGAPFRALLPDPDPEAVPAG